MKNNKFIAGIQEIALALIVSFLYLNLAVNVSLGLLVLLAIPYIIIGVRNGNHMANLGIIIFSSLVAFLINKELGLVLFILLGPITGFLVYGLTNKKDKYSNLYIGTFIIALSVVASLLVEKYLGSMEIAQAFELAFKTSLESWTQSAQQLGLNSRELLKGKAALIQGYSLMLMSLPVILLFASFINMYIIYKISASMLNRSGYKEIYIPKVHLFQLPNNIITGAITMFLAGKLVEALQLPLADELQINIMLLIGLLFLLQGIALMDYFFVRLMVGKFFRVILIVLNLFVLRIGGFLILLGLADSVFDFRKIRNKAK